MRHDVAAALCAAFVPEDRGALSVEHEVRSEVSLRPARLDDLPVLVELIAESARGLCRGDYTAAQIEAAIGLAWGVDTQLVRDGTYYVAEAAGQVVGCGGWSYRATLFGADAESGRRPGTLDPQTDAARIRAFFVRPYWARRGIGAALLRRCEAETRAHGFRAAELMATLPGTRLYAAFGYAGEERVRYPLPGDLTIDFVPMRRDLVTP
jgi:GNAT superfamily N-acetyltransferase